MTYFTSDQHFGHFNIIRLCSRPFETVEEMDEALLSKWNAKVKADDTVYILGDLFFRAAKVEPILKALNGRKHIIVGNHDHTWMKRVEASDRKVWGLSPRELRTIFSPRFAKSS
jgi:calcineurin-like phosphoesterase family protein